MRAVPEVPVARVARAVTPGATMGTNVQGAADLTGQRSEDSREPPGTSGENGWSYAIFDWGTGDGFTPEVNDNNILEHGTGGTFGRHQLLMLPRRQ